jgi:hypothetical protein
MTVRPIYVPPPGFNLGDVVEVTESSPYHGDFRGERFVVIGIRLVHPHRLDITIADGPSDRGGWSCPADGFEPYELRRVETAA